MASWSALHDELDRWHAAGRTATLWWRDDDAMAATPALDRLLTLAGRWRVPLAIAAVPARTEAGLAARLSWEAGVAVLQHGHAHVSHAPAGARKAELGDDRPAAIVAAELRAGWRRLRKLFGARALPVLVPPWNRIAPVHAEALAALGYKGLSTFGPRCNRAIRGVVKVNGHVDPIAWRGARGFVGEDSALAALTGHLRARRLGQADAAEPTGLLTHHLVHDAAGWAFLERLFAATAQAPAARWLTAAEAFEFRVPADEGAPPC